MNKQLIAIMGTGPLGLWTAAALAGDLQGTGLHIRMGNTRGKAPAWVPEAVQTATDAGRLSWHAFNALDLSSVQQFAKDADVIVHSAIPDYHLWVDQLPTIQRNAIQAALFNHARLICADNLYAYAPPVHGPLTEDSEELPPSGKGQLRKDMLDLLRQAGRERGLEWSTVQASQYFGPGAGRQSVFGDWFIGPVLQNKPVRFVGNPGLRHAWAYAPDFGRAMALLSLTERNELLKRSWILPHVTQISARDLAQTMFNELDKQGMLSAEASRKTVAVPRFVLRLLGIFNPVVRARDEMLYQFVMDFEASGAQLTKATGLEATPLDQAVQETVKFWSSTKAQSI